MTTGPVPPKAGSEATPQIDLVQWLTEQIDQDEELARAAGGACWHADYCDNDGPAFHKAFDHDRVLRQVAAYRRILGAVERWRDPHPGVPCDNVGNPWVACELHVAAKDRLDPYALRVLASIYADRPGFDPSWTVE